MQICDMWFGQQFQKNLGIGIKNFSNEINIIIEKNDIVGTTGISIHKLREGKFIFKDNKVLSSKENAVYINLTYYKPIQIDGGLDKNTVTGDVSLSGIFQQDMLLQKRVYHLKNFNIAIGAMLVVNAGNILKSSGLIKVFGA